MAFTSASLLFANFRLDPETTRVWRDDQPLALTPKAVAILHYLLTHPDRVIPKAELLHAVWPETGGSVAALKVCFSELRKALGDDPRSPAFIETVPRVGYRFIAPLNSASPAVSNQSAVGSADTGRNSPLTPGNQQLATRLVGRDAELEQLRGWWVKALEGDRQAIFVSGEPGIGKTALADAFLAQVGQEASDRGQEFVSLPAHSSSPQPQAPRPWIGRGQCVEQYGAGEAYLPLLEALSRLGREPGGDDIVAVLAQYAPTWLAQLPSLVDLSERDTVQRALIGATRERMLREIAEALEVLSARRPCLLVLEDLHWSDPSTMEVLAYVARRRGPARLLILGTYRPTAPLANGNPLKSTVQELQGRGHGEELRLALLSEAEVNAYVRQRVPHLSTLSQLPTVIYRRTEGNPLFMVTVVEQLARDGGVREPTRYGQIEEYSAVLTTKVPESLRQLIEKQFGGLEKATQQILEAASVIGTEFGVAAVAAAAEQPPEVVESCCAELAATGQFLRPVGIEEWPDGTLGERFSFLHALYRDTLHTRVNEVRRVRLHRRIGERKEAAYGKRAGEIAAELATHFEQGRDFKQAVKYLGKAGENAVRRTAHQEAIGLVAKGLEFLQAMPDIPQRLQQELQLLTILGSALIATRGYGTLEVERTYARAYEICQQLGDAPQLSSILHGLRVFYYVRADLPKARELGEQLLRVAQKAAHPFLILSAHVALGETLCAQGELSLTHAHFEQVWTLYDPRQHSPWASRTWIDPGVVGFCMGAMTLWLLGYPDQAAEKEQAALRLAQELSHPFSLAYTLARTGVLRLHRGEVQTSREQAEALIALTRHHGFPFFLPHGLVQLGVALTAQGQGEAGITQIRQGLAEMRIVGNEVAMPRPLAMLAQAYASLGQSAEGLTLLAEAIESADKGGETTWEAEFYRLYGELSLRAGERENGRRKDQKTIPPSPILSLSHSSPEACFLKAIEIARRQQAKALELRAAMSLARLWQSQGKSGVARALLEEIYHWFTEGFDTKDLQEAAALLTALGGNAVTKQQKETTTALPLSASFSGRSHITAAPIASHPDPDTHPQPKTPDGTPPAFEGDFPAPNTFRYEGDHWTLTFAGKVCRLKDAHGLHYLARLLQHPRHEFHVFDLVYGNAPQAGTSPSTGKTLHAPELPLTHTNEIGDAGKVFDSQARAAYKQRLAELRAELDEARKFHDMGRSEKLTAEIDFLAQALANAMGLGGRARKANSPTERARLSVTRTIKIALRKIAANHPPLGQHLVTTIRTGTYCSYTPDSRLPITWQM